MSGFAKAIADGRAEAFGGRQRAENDVAARGIERAQAGIETTGELLRLGPASPVKNLYSRWRQRSELVWQHEANALKRVLGCCFGERAGQPVEQIFH